MPSVCNDNTIFDYDVLIIGAGPAGAILARLLKKHFRIGIIDKKHAGTDSFHKPCGGLLSTDAQQALSRFGLTLPKELLVSPQIFAVKTIDLGSGLIRHYQRFYMNMDRHKFDLWLMSLMGEDIDLLPGRCSAISRNRDSFSVEYVGETVERNLSCRYIVGADGAASIVRRSLFPSEKLRQYMAIQEWYPENHANPFYSCVFDSETSDCCSWSISKDNYFIFGGAFAKKNAHENFEKQKEKLRTFGFLFTEPIKTEACLVNRPSGWHDFCIGGHGAFLVGEAAGFISPSSLEGFSWAIKSATQLAEALIKAPVGGANALYRRKTFTLRCKLMMKVLKSPFLYQPFLRRLVMKSGINSIDMIDS